LLILFRSGKAQVNKTAKRTKCSKDFAHFYLLLHTSKPLLMPATTIFLHFIDKAALLVVAARLQ
jgi:hypothetical protein